MIIPKFIKKIVNKNKILFKILKLYWLILYFSKIIYDAQNFYLLTKSQNHNKEAESLKDLIPFVKNKNFIEIGFHFRQFNTVDLIKDNFQGKLIDTSKYDFFNLFLTKFIIKRILKRNIEVIDCFVKPDNVLDNFDKKNIGYLSIDIDSNDYWVLNKILEEKYYPEVIILEYNASFLKNSITIPYIENFNLYKYHQSHCYYGASLTAFDKLLSNHNYNLVETIAGVNAIFVNNEIFKRINKLKLSPLNIDQECESKNRILKNSSKEQYEMIKHLPFIKV